jgi:hypothetical protein
MSKKFVALGQGGHGCVGAPIMQCLNNRSLVSLAAKQNVVGKIVDSKSDADEEMGGAAIIRKVDPHEVFTIIPLGACQVRPRRADFGKNCDDIGPKLMRAMRDDHSSELPQLVVRNGGKDLDDKTVRALPLRSVLISMTPVVKGLIALKAAGVVHADIKPGNIVYQGGVSKLIDFGMVRSNARRDILLEYYKFDLIAHTYPAYPPEWDWLTHIRSGLAENLKTEMMDNTQTDSIREMVVLCRRPQYHSKAALAAMDKGMMALAVPNTRLRPEEAYRQLMRDLSKTKLWEKIDIYSLGVAVGDVVLDRMPNHGLTDEEFYKVTGWIAKATNFDPFTRMTPEEAYREWVAIWQRGGSATAAAAAAAAATAAATAGAGAAAAPRARSASRRRPRTASPASCKRVSSLIASRPAPAYVASDCKGQVKGGQLHKYDDSYRSVANKAGVYYWRPEA